MFNIWQWLKNKLSRSNGGYGRVVFSNEAALDLPANVELKITVEGCGGGGGCKPAPHNCGQNGAGTCGKCSSVVIKQVKI